MERCLFFRRFSVVLCLSLGLTVGLWGTAPQDLAKVQSKPAQQSPSTPTASPSQSPAVTPPNHTNTERYTLSHKRYEEAVAYSRAGYTLYFVSFFLSVAVLLLVLWLGIAARYRDIAETVTDKRWIQALIFVPLLVVTLDAFDLPIHAYGHRLSLRYEVSVQRWGPWLWDWFKGELLSVILTLVFALILFTFLRRSPRRWWLYFWLAALPIIVAVTFSRPWIIDPMFNRFEPLSATHPELAKEVARLTEHAGILIPPDRMFVMDASEKTTAVNAYITGWGASKRLVIWDTTLKRTTREEALFIIAHELGHYVLRHTQKGFAFFSAFLFAAVYLLFRGLHWSLGRWGARWRIYGPEDWASLAVLLLLLQIIFFLGSPVINGFSRMQEHDADIYGLELIHGLVPNSAEVAAHAFQQLGEIDLADPNPPAFITIWLYSHPPLADRLVFAYSYDPWSKGEAPKYVK
jgi:Zn-dependent protease with chaperone function